MPSDIQPLLGEVAAFTISTPDLNQSLGFYECLGFKEVMRADWPFPWIQVSDGVLLIMLRKDDKPYIALTYYVKEIDEVAAVLEGQGIDFIARPGPKDAIKKYLFQSPDGINISLVSMVAGFRNPAGPGMLQMQQEDYFRPEKYINKQCGLYGEFAHPVKDLEVTMGFWNLLGFKGVSEYSEPYSWAIMTDGLSVIGLHQTGHFEYPALTYFAADMQQKLARLSAKGVAGLTIKSAGNAQLTSPEGQHIFLYQLGDIAAPSPSLDDITVIAAETDRLLLQELNPVVMDRLFTSFDDEAIMNFLGLADEQELALEKKRFNQGLTNYRTSFRAFLLIEKSTDNVIGKAGYHSWYEEHSRAEIGYAITDDDAKRKGYMKEALEVIVAIGFRHMGLNRIEALIGAENEPSLKLAKGLGFVYEGLLRSHYFKNNRMEDSLCFSLLSSEYTMPAELAEVVG